MSAPSGAIRFLEGFYIVLATKIKYITNLGYHALYKIEETTMIYVPYDDTTRSNNEEQRYFRAFQMVDLTTDFYCSYTYNLSRTLQENVKIHMSGFNESSTNHTLFDDGRFVWNQFLMTPFKTAGVDTKRWLLPLIHGVINVRVLSLFASNISVILIARRSCRFAGTRFLKRGADFDGHVANEVETEQDQTKMVAKPQIEIGLCDPFAYISGKHFRDMISKYGVPLIIVNLVKQREKRKHESILSDSMKEDVQYLNQFLEPKKRIEIINFDMARCNKRGNVLTKLESIAHFVLRKNRWFQTFRPLYSHHIVLSNDIEDNTREDSSDRLSWQQGIARTNCVDCLDRTNTAQFVIGKVALAYQLYSLGVINTAFLDLNTEPVRVLEELYQEQGDTLAMQYAGSQLVHSVKSYKKTGGLFQERTRDVIQTMSRYYSNTFSDAEKQNSINLFLGIYKPGGKLPPMWDMTTDAYLHNACGWNSAIESLCEWFEWFDVDASSDRRPKTILSSEDDSNSGYSSEFDPTDDYERHYRPWELTSFDTVLTRLKTRCYPVASLTAPMPDSAGGLSKIWKRSPHDPNAGNDVDLISQSNDKSGAPVPNGEEHSDEEDTLDESEIDDNVPPLPKDLITAYPATNVQRLTNIWLKMRGQQQETLYQSAEKQPAPRFSEAFIGSVKPLSMSSIFPSSKEHYGFVLTDPSSSDIEKYSQFSVLSLQKDATADWAKFARDKWNQALKLPYHGQPASEGWAAEPDGLSQPGSKIVRVTDYWFNDKITPLSDYEAYFYQYQTRDHGPIVTPHARQMYKKAVFCAKVGPSSPSAADLAIYQNYVTAYKSKCVKLK